MVTLHPVALGTPERNGSIIALVATSLVGDVKGEWYSDSSNDMMAYAQELRSTPDTFLYLYNTANDGTRTGTPFAVISRDGYTSLVEGVE